MIPSCQLHLSAMSLSTTWTYFLNSSRKSNSSTSLHSLFQCLTTPLGSSEGKVPPETPFLQAEAPQLPQLLLISLDEELHCTSLVQQLSVLVARGPELDTGLEVRPHLPVSPQPSLTLSLCPPSPRLCPGSSAAPRRSAAELGTVRRGAAAARALGRTGVPSIA